MSTNKPWGGRFSEATDPIVERFSTSIHFDRVLARHDLRGSRAQARMLGSTGLISNEDALTLVAGLDQIAKEVEDDTLPLDPALEDYPPVREPTDVSIDHAMSTSFGFGGTNAALVLSRTARRSS